jgi:HPt (histidine-containing phosphotransfer) domain-containing protein
MRGDMTIGIPGVDEQKFVSLFEGDTELYMSVLRSFTEKTPGVMDKLRNVSQAALPAYIDNIHSLKGACANVCAEEAREKALNLEMMAKAGDFPGVLACNEAFLKYMEDLLDGLQNWLKDQ